MFHHYSLQLFHPLSLQQTHPNRLRLQHLNLVVHQPLSQVLVLVVLHLRHRLGLRNHPHNHRHIHPHPHRVILHTFRLVSRLYHLPLNRPVNLHRFQVVRRLNRRILLRYNHLAHHLQRLLVSHQVIHHNPLANHRLFHRFPHPINLPVVLRRPQLHILRHIPLCNRPLPRLGIHPLVLQVAPLYNLSLHQPFSLRINRHQGLPLNRLTNHLQSLLFNPHRFHLVFPPLILHSNQVIFVLRYHPLSLPNDLCHCQPQTLPQTTFIISIYVTFITSF